MTIRMYKKQNKKKKLNERIGNNDHMRMHKDETY